MGTACATYVEKREIDKTRETAGEGNKNNSHSRPGAEDNALPCVIDTPTAVGVALAAARRKATSRPVRFADLANIVFQHTPFPTTSMPKKACSGRPLRPLLIDACCNLAPELWVRTRLSRLRNRKSPRQSKNEIVDVCTLVPSRNPPKFTGSLCLSWG